MSDHDDNSTPPPAQPLPDAAEDCEVEDSEAEDSDAECSTGKESGEPQPSDDERQRRIRERLRQMYGDDSPETVRRFLHDLTTGNPEEPPS